MACGELAPAMQHSQEGLRQSRAAGDDVWTALPLAQRSGLESMLGHMNRAAQLAGARANLGDPQYAAAWAAGEAMSLEQAVKVALGEALA